MDKILSFVRDESGLTTVEYAVAGGLISLAVIGAFEALGGTVSRIIGEISNQLGGPGGAPAPAL
jgi:pilus assembly protein Flp/PilA